MANEVDVIAAVKKSLCSYLETNMPSIAQVIDDWANPSEELKYPSMTVFTGNPTYESVDPYVISKDDPAQGATETLVRYVVGTYQFKLQCDIWTEYKPQRNSMYQEFFNAINKDVIPPGLRLPLTNYFGAIAIFNIMGFSFPDSEESATKKEWRCKVDLICDALHVVERLEKIMVAIENTSAEPEADETIIEDEIPDDSDEFITTII